MLNNIVNRYLAKTARITEQKAFINYLPGGAGHTRGDMAYLRVEGNTFPIKDALKAAGLRWQTTKGTPYWGLEAFTYSPYDRNWGRSLEAIKAAYPKVKAIVDKFNAEVDAKNKAMQPERPQNLQQLSQRFDAIERRNKFFAAAGLDLKTTARGPFSPEITLYITGNTYPLVAVFRKFGWKWWNEQKAWALPFDEWAAIEKQFLAALGPAIARMAPAQQEAPAAPTTFPWSKGEVWLENTANEDEAEDTGVLFTPLGPQYVGVKTTYHFKEYETGTKRMTNEEAFKVWERLTKNGVYRPR